MDEWEEYPHGSIPSITCPAISSRVMGDANRFTQSCTVHAIHAVNDSAPPNVVSSHVIMDTTNNNNNDKASLLDYSDGILAEMTLEEKLQKSKSSLGDMILCPHK